MKILDASAVTAIFPCPGHVGLIDKPLPLGRTVAIPSHVMECELPDARIRAAVDRMASKGKITILDINEYGTVVRFSGDCEPDTGECDVMLSCRVLAGAGTRTYCIIDDADARDVAADLGIPLGGLAGIFRMMIERSIMAPEEAGGIPARMKEGGFHMTDDLIRWACTGG